MNCLKVAWCMVALRPCSRHHMFQWSYHVKLAVYFVTGASRMCISFYDFYIKRSLTRSPVTIAIRPYLNPARAPKPLHNYVFWPGSYQANLLCPPRARQVSVCSKFQFFSCLTTPWGFVGSRPFLTTPPPMLTNGQCMLRTFPRPLPLTTMSRKCLRLLETSFTWGTYVWTIDRSYFREKTWAIWPMEKQAQNLYHIIWKASL